MTVQNPPIFLQSEAHPAEDVRRALVSLISGEEGVVEAGDMAVTQSVTPGMSVLVASGQAWISGTEAVYQGSYYVDNRGDATIILTASDGSNPRIDRICARVKDSDYSGADNEWELVAIAGTPAATPSVPAAPDNSITLATVEVAASSTTVLNASITDTRPVLPIAYAPGGTDVAVVDGGTGASTASAARSNLGLEIGTDVAAHSVALANTTASFTSALKTKLDGVEAGADATDSANVQSAGAHMSGGTDVPVADGGTGSSTAAGARANLGAQSSSITDAGGLVLATTVDGALQEIFSGSFAVNTNNATGSTETLTLAPAHAMTMNTNCTFTFPNPSTNGHSFTVYLAGSFTPTWPNSVKWNNNTEPTHSTPSVYVFTTFNSGATWLGAQVGKGFA